MSAPAAPPSPAIDDVIDLFFAARKAIFAHVGYVEDWRVLPINDSRDQFWAVDKDEREWVRFSPSHRPSRTGSRRTNLPHGIRLLIARSTSSATCRGRSIVRVCLRHRHCSHQVTRTNMARTATYSSKTRSTRSATCPGGSIVDLS